MTNTPPYTLLYTPANTPANTSGAARHASSRQRRFAPAKLAAAVFAAGSLIAGPLLASSSASAQAPASSQLALFELPEIELPEIDWPEIELPEIELPDLGVYENKAGLDPAPRPRYRVGQRFTFSDGSTQTVAAMEGDAVVWRNHKGRRIKSHSFLDGWASARRLRVVERPAAIWPLKVGSFDRLRVQGSKRQDDGTRKPLRVREHACQVMGSERITVAAGTFDAYRVECKRYGNKRMAERRIWHFAPAIGHYVRYERLTRKGGRQEYRELVGRSG